MRDFVVTAIILGSIPFILRRPYIGILVWVWISVMNPHRLTWGFAYELPFAAMIAGATLVSTLIHPEQRNPLPINSLTVTLFLFIAWTAVTTLLAFYPEQAFPVWTTFMKTQLMAFLIVVLFRSREQLQQLIWVIVLSLVYYGFKGGVFILRMGGEGRVWGPMGSYIEDNNALAVAIVMIIPLLRFLQLSTSKKQIRWGLTVAMVVCGLSVLGSQSRGALIAVSTMIIFMCWKSRQKLQIMLVAVLAIPIALSIMPAAWFERMETIANYDKDTTGSASMRFNSWATMFNVAKDRPLLGGGFEVGTREVYDRYAPDPQFPPQTAHSIYFQAMGEHGFVGFILYVLTCFLFWRQAGALARVTRGYPQLAWAHNLGLMMQVSLVGFLVGGAFLSLVAYDVPYYLLFAVVATRVLVDRELRTAGPAQAAAVPPNRFSSIPAHRLRNQSGGPT